MKIKTADLIDEALDWAVAKCEGLDAGRFYGLGGYSTNWAQGGSIIERDGIRIERWPNTEAWVAQLSEGAELGVYWRMSGPTPLIAAMRCYVASKLGDEVDVPDELTSV